MPIASDTDYCSRHCPECGCRLVYRVVPYLQGDVLIDSGFVCCRRCQVGYRWLLSPAPTLFDARDEQRLWDRLERKFMVYFGITKSARVAQLVRAPDC